MMCELAASTDQAGAAGWLYELKLDGVRGVASREGDSVTLWSRKGRDVTATYPEVVDAMRSIAAEDVILDGEVVAFDAEGRPSFGRLQRRMHLTETHDVAWGRREVPVVYVVFDVLSIGGRSLLETPLVERRKLLTACVGDAKGPVRVLDAYEDNGRALLAFCEQRGLEGIVAKRAQSIYQPGLRSRDWLKIKCTTEDDFVVIGYTSGLNARERLGAIDVASFDGDRLVVRGKVGSGLDDETIDRVLARLAPMVVPACAAEGDLERAPRGRTFVRPELVVRVRFQGWTDEGKLRAPVYRGIREDLAPDDCRAVPPRAA